MKHNVKCLLIMAVALMAATGLSSCSSDDNEPGTPYFTIEGQEDATKFVCDFSCEGVDTTAYSSATQLVVRSNCAWQLVARATGGEDMWARVFPMSGEGDGIIRVSSNSNATPDVREQVYDIIVNGQSTGQTLVVSETGAEPYLRGSATKLEIARVGGDVQFVVTTNVSYEFSLEGDNTSWVTVERDAANDNLLVLHASENLSGDDLSATLHLQGTGSHSDLSVDVPISQTAALIFDNFQWMTADGAMPQGWDTTNESNYRFDKWTAEMLSYGWVSRSTWCYGRPGFIKLGKTNYGGDVISPKLTELGGTANVKVSFQAVGYCSAAGLVDGQELYVGILGPGEITSVTCDDSAFGGDVDASFAYVDENGGDITLKGAHVTLARDNHFNPTTDPTGLLIWDETFTHYSVTVEGASAETQVVFVGGLYDSAQGQLSTNKNRIFLDNFKVARIK